MRIILLQNVKNIGKAGDVKNVPDGYACNFLIPKKLAEIATNSAIKKCEEFKKKKDLEEKKNLDRFQELAKSLAGTRITIKAKEKEGRLFGSISAKEIAHGLKKQNFNVEAKAIKVDQPIKEVGEKDIAIKLGNGIEVMIKLMVEAE